LRVELLLAISEEAFAVDWPLEQAARRSGARRQEGGRPPMAVRDFGGEPDAARCPSSQRFHVGFGPGLVDEDQALRLNPVLIFCPLRPLAGDVGTVAFTGDDGFF